MCIHPKKCVMLALKNEKFAFWSAFAVLISLAWLNRFILDDAFISFRYAANWIRGNGLVWNPGEKVEGYTNFLWILLVGAGMKLGLDPVAWSFVLGLFCFTLSLFFICRLAVLEFESRWIGILVMFLLGTNYTFSAYATGGLETQLQACLFVVCTFLVFDSIKHADWRISRLIGLSVLLGLSVLTRIDSILFCFVVFPIVLYFICKGKNTFHLKGRQLLGLLLPFFVLVGLWLFWKVIYYGDIFSNTYYVKVVSLGASVKRGAHYVYLFFLSYGLLPFFLFVPLCFQKIRNSSNRRIVVTAVGMLLWMLYVVRVGGDFMEFRFMVPVLPFVIFLIVWMVYKCVQQKAVRIIFMLIIFFGSLHHRLRFGQFVATGGVEPVRMLEHHLKHEEEDWIQIGKVLGRAFQGCPEVTIATTACGAIPYYSNLKTLDMLGLNDPWVAKHGRIVNVKTGHRKMTPFSNLIENRVHLIIGHPFMKPVQDTTKTVWFGMMYKHIEDKKLIPKNSQFLEIPINKSYKLVVYYLTPDPVVDRVILENHWTAYPVFHEQKPSS